MAVRRRRRRCRRCRRRRRRRRHAGCQRTRPSSTPAQRRCPCPRGSRAAAARVAHAWAWARARGRPHQGSSSRYRPSVQQTPMAPQRRRGLQLPGGFSAAGSGSTACRTTSPAVAAPPPPPPRHSRRRGRRRQGRRGCCRGRRKHHRCCCRRPPGRTSTRPRRSLRCETRAAASHTPAALPGQGELQPQAQLQAQWQGLFESCRPAPAPTDPAAAASARCWNRSAQWTHHSRSVPAACL
mmetsp:Transcript_14017/g.40649  ORF Transcript_14017/g.40649 Transcript_14017/m.40649 type:complete len:239 (+) Transcript_14017:2383-3099(+)